jgi:hypothetical protein
MWKAIVDNQIYFFVAFGVLIPLLGYAVYLQLKTYKGLVSKREEEVENKKKAFKERQESLKESIRIISMATIQKQCEISEACLRLANLLPHYRGVRHREDQYKALFDMFDEIKHLKTHKDRNEMKIAQRHQEDRVRYQAEEKYEKDILAICQVLYQATDNRDENGSKSNGKH